jgi:glycosyltransferase involved in cell wall biosynthesis
VTGGRSAARLSIAFLSNEYPPVPDGIGSYVASIAPALAARGHEVHVISCREAQPATDELDRGVHVHRRPLRELPGVVRPWIRGLPRSSGRLRTALTAAREVRALHVDVAEAPDWMAEGLVVPLGRIPLVAHLHTPLALTWEQARLPRDRDVAIADWFERTAVARADRATSPSGLLVAALTARGWLRREDVEVIPLPVDVGRWSNVGPIGSGHPVVLVVGRLERLKAPELAVEACASIPDAEVVVVGRSQEHRDGMPYDAWLAERATRAGVRLRLAGQVPARELARFYELASVLVIPSSFDNFPVVALEALAAGRPVVCTNMTGTAELLAGTDAGEVVPAGDSAAMAEALQRVLRKAEAAGEAARRLVTDVCSPDAIAARREAVYAHAVDVHRRRGSRLRRP